MNYYVFGSVSKRTKSIASFALALVMVLQAVAPSVAYATNGKPFQPDGTEDVQKVNICHKDGNSGNWNALNVSSNGWSGHSGHSDDYLYAGPLDDGKPDSHNHNDDNWCKNHVPVIDEPAPCLIPVAVVEGSKISGFGVSPEVTLQQVLNTAYPSASLNSVTSETGIQAWTIPSGTDSVSVNVKLLSASAGNTNELGYYFDGDTSNFVSLFTVPGGLNSVSPVNVTINTTGHNTIAFALKTGSTVFASENTKNAGNEDHAVVYTPAANTYAIAFEDVSLGSADKDYNDLVAEVKVTSCTHNGNQCVPSSGTVSSDTTTKVTDINGVAANSDAVLVSATSVTTSAWTATVSDVNAQWVWSENPVAGWTADKTVTFTKKFTITGTPNAGSITIAADNTYDITLNGNAIGQDLTGTLATFQTAKTYTITAGQFVTGENTLVIKVKNLGQGDESANSQLSNPAGLLYTLSWSSNCGGNENPNHPTHTITFHKYLDGAVANTNASFSVNWATGNSPTNPITLNSANSFTQTTSSIEENTAVSWSETMGENMVSSVESCTPGKFYNDGYSWGNDLSGAVSNKSNNTSGVNSVSSDIHVVVWNKSCPTKATVVATKIVCTNEADLPNWGNGAGGAITANTASTFLASHPNCHVQPNWTFQWAPSVATNPGDNEMSAGSPWTNSGVTANDGTISIEIPVTTNGGFVWMREVPKEGYIPFTGDTNGSDGWNDVSAEMYCSVDHLNYDNYDRVDNVVAGQTYHCVAWNVPTTPTDHGGSQSGTLIVKKEVKGSEVSPSAFSFTIDDGSAVAFDTDGQNDMTVSVGTHTVTEVVAPGYTTTYSGCSEVSIANGETKTCTITNTKIVNEITHNDDNTPTDTPTGGSSRSGGSRRGGSVAGASTNVPNVGSVLGAATDVPNLPNTGNGAHSQTLMITLSLIASLFAINAVAIRKIKNS